MFSLFCSQMAAIIWESFAGKESVGYFPVEFGFHPMKPWMPGILLIGAYPVARRLSTHSRMTRGVTLRMAILTKRQMLSCHILKEVHQDTPWMSYIL